MVSLKKERRWRKGEESEGKKIGGREKGARKEKERGREGGREEKNFNPEDAHVWLSSIIPSREDRYQAEIKESSPCELPSDPHTHLSMKQEIMADGPRCKRRKQANPRRKNVRRSTQLGSSAPESRCCHFLSPQKGAAIDGVGCEREIIPNSAPGPFQWPNTEEDVRRMRINKSETPPPTTWPKARRARAHFVLLVFLPTPSLGSEEGGQRSGQNVSFSARSNLRRKVSASGAFLTDSARNPRRFLHAVGGAVQNEKVREAKGQWCRVVAQPTQVGQ
ncbi:unnamed protein product [Menidia menidia]|uniref:(Atlantic silverside) hypothetical protein n=1 Tax=Menidia menidia TaxID=238744 RepID=A0A8S4B681_9TELE|nr:unnamed protein product [Menidia menidia]